MSAICSLDDLKDTIDSFHDSFGEAFVIDLEDLVFDFDEWQMLEMLESYDWTIKNGYLIVNY